MHDLYNLKESLVKELEEFGKRGDVSRNSLDTIDKLAHATKNLTKVIECCEEEGYSNYGGYSRREPSADYVRPDGSYRDGGMSYARGRGAGARRDAMGRYSRSGEGVDPHTKEELMKLIENM